MVNLNIGYLKELMVCPKSGTLWTFGYASLIWKPGFEYSNRIVGYIRGYKRRFYQGSTTHRGTPDWPGRVATIIKDDTSEVWGVAFEVKKEDDIWKALVHLIEREIETGGYHFDKVKFYPEDKTLNPIDICVYVADPKNLQYLGSGGSIEIQAYQILKSEGICGPNSEYVEKVVDFMKSELKIADWRKIDKYLWKLYKMIIDFKNGVIKPSKKLLKVVPLDVNIGRADEDELSRDEYLSD